MKRLILLNIFLSCTILTQNVPSEKAKNKQTAGIITGIGTAIIASAATWYYYRYMGAQDYQSAKPLLNLFEMAGWTGIDNKVKDTIISTADENSAVAAAIAGAVTGLAGIICRGSNKEKHRSFGSGLIKGSLATLAVVAAFFIPQYINAEQISL
jgi:uncharacterized membrane protein YjfL (UPF0719 family)